MEILLNKTNRYVDVCQVNQLPLLRYKIRFHFIPMD